MKTWKSSSKLSYYLNKLNKALLTVVSLMLAGLTFAQQQAQTIGANNNNEGRSSSMASAVVWIIGLAFFVVLLITILRPKKRI